MVFVFCTEILNDSEIVYKYLYSICIHINQNVFYEENVRKLIKGQSKR